MNLQSFRKNIADLRTTGQSLEASYFLYWTDSRHHHSGPGLSKPPSSSPADRLVDWRNRGRVKTTVGVLVICLLIGDVPPDVIKTDPCAKLECWIDPKAGPRDIATQQMGKNFQTQLESLVAVPCTRYSQLLDPPAEDVKAFCMAARKSAKNERVLFYYNGHGVPRPTIGGEI